jgi:uncharacterized protein YfaP (DUF2135 family)
MKKLTLLIVFATLFINWSFSQIDQKMKKIEDVGVESQGLHTIRFANASDGAPVAYAKIEIQGNKSILTDAEGKIRFEKKSDGTYPFKFEKKGFISEEFQIKVSSGKIIDNRFVVSTALKKNEYRIVLIWDEKPADLDVHFIKDETYRVSSKDLQKSPDSLVELESESIIGYGPESILIYGMDSIGSAIFVVNDYSNKDMENSIALSKSDARIKIYSDGKLEYTWRPSKKQTGNVWMVFALENGEIIPTEEVHKD